VAAVAAAFTAYDIKRLVGLFMQRAESHIVGMLTEDSRDQIARGSVLHTLDTERDRRYRGEVVDIGGEPMVVLWTRPTDDSAQEAMTDLLRLETTDQGIRPIEWYFFCPEVLAEVAASLGVLVRTNGYHY
jgi:RNA polymerase sigma-70 factor, ECF subfamily